MMQISVDPHGCGRHGGGVTWRSPVRPGINTVLILRRLGLTASRKLAGSVASSSVIFGVARCPLLQSTVWIYVD